MIRKDVYRFIINVPFKYKDIAKENGGKWNGLSKHWYTYNRQVKENIERKIKEQQN